MEREIDVAKLQQFLAEHGGETICPRQLNDLIEKASRKTVPLIVAKEILAPKSTDILDTVAVIETLAKKGIKIELTDKERGEALVVPFSRETLEMAAQRKWRGKRAILWYAPPERFGITMLTLRKAFGADTDTQPCIYDNDWWFKEKFAKEVLPEGWHLTLAEIPDGARNKSYDDQKKLMAENEILVKPVELMFLSLVNYEINRGERLFESVYARTDTLDSFGGVVSLGCFVTVGLYVDSWCPASRVSLVGLLLSRKFD